MLTDNRLKVWNKINTDFPNNNLGTFEDFNREMENPKRVKDLHEYIGKVYDSNPYSLEQFNVLMQNRDYEPEREKQLTEIHKRVDAQDGIQTTPVQAVSGTTPMQWLGDKVANAWGGLKEGTLVQFPRALGNIIEGSSIPLPLTVPTPQVQEQTKLKNIPGVIDFTKSLKEFAEEEEQKGTLSGIDRTSPEYQISQGLGTVAQSMAVGVVSSVPSGGAAPAAYIGGFAYTYMLEGGLARDEAIKAGVNEEDANLVMHGVGTINGALEVGLGIPMKMLRKMGLIKGLSRDITKKIVEDGPVRSFLKETVKTGFYEGSTEALQEIVSLTAEHLSRDTKPTKEEWIDRIGQSGFYGFIVGGIAAGGGHPFTYRNAKKTEGAFEIAKLKQTFLTHENFEEAYKQTGNVNNALKVAIPDEAGLQAFTNYVQSTDEFKAVKDGLRKQNPELTEEQAIGLAYETVAQKDSPLKQKFADGFILASDEINRNRGIVDTYKTIFPKVEKGQYTEEEDPYKIDESEATDDTYFQKELYHGTIKDFTSFKTEGIEKLHYKKDDEGIYFTSNKEIAKNYAIEEQDPYGVYEGIDLPDKLGRIITAELTTEKIKTINVSDYKIKDKTKIIQDAKKEGYEAVQFIIQDKETNKSVDEFIVFNPEKIKILKSENLIQFQKSQLSQSKTTYGQIVGNQKELFDEEKLLKQKSFRSKPIEFGKIEEGVALRNKKDKILMDLDLLKEKFKAKAWTNPRVKGVKPLAENQFKSFDEFLTFAMIHEVTHDTIKQNANESTADYENRINESALSELDNNYQKPQSFKSIESKLSQKDNSILPLSNWIRDKIGDTKVEFVNNKTMTPKGSFGENNARGAFRFVDGKPVIQINTDATGSIEDLHRTLVHEGVHAFTVKGLKDNRVFKSQVNGLRNEILNRFANDHKQFYEDNKEKMDYALSNDEEFLSEVLSGSSSELREWMRNTTLDNTTKQTILQKLKSLIKALFGKDFTHMEALELVLNRTFGTPVSFTAKDDANFTIPDIIQDKLALDKNLLLGDSDLTDIRTISSLVKIIEEDKKIDDPIQYLKEKKIDKVIEKLSKSPQFKETAQYYYNAYYKDGFNSVDEYIEAIARQLHNQALSLEKRTVIRPVISHNLDQETDRTTGTTDIIELPMYYKNKDGALESSYKNQILLSYMLPHLKNLFGVDFEIVYIDQIKVVNSIDGYVQSEDWVNLAEDKRVSRNHDFNKMFLNKGYIFLGTWADKKTVIALKPSIEGGDAIELINNKLAEIEEVYKGKQKKLLETFDAKGIKLKSAEEYSNWDNPQYQEHKINYLLKALMYDLDLGGSIVDGKLNSALYNFENPMSWDAIKTYKRPPLILPMKMFSLEEDKVNKMLKDIPFNHGMSIGKRGLQGRAFIFDSKVKPGEMTLPGTDIDLHDLLVNEFGTEDTDGKIIYTLGGFDKIYQYIHGVLKPGAIKAFAASKYPDTPLYLKGAFHGYGTKETITGWMQKNDITFLISSSAAKKSGYQKGNLFDVKVSDKIFELPFDIIYRDLEKDSAKNKGRGAIQLLTTNYFTKSNKWIKDLGMGEALNNYLQRTTAAYMDKISAFDQSDVMDIMLSKALTAKSNYERTLSQSVLALAYTETDKQYSNLKLVNAIQNDPDIQNLISQVKLMKVKKTDTLAQKIGNLFQIPSFNKIIQDAMKEDLENLFNGVNNGSWLTLAGDIGFLAPMRYNQAKKFARETFRVNMKKNFLVYSDQLLKSTEAIRNLNSQIDELLKEGDKNQTKINELLLEVKGFEKDQTDVEKKLRFYDDAGNFNMRTKTAKKLVQKQLDKWIDPKSGRLKEGFTYITKDVADLYNLKLGDDLIHNVVPGDWFIGTGASKIIGIFDSSISEPGKIVLNSEYIQSILGKDFDIDTVFILPQRGNFTRKEYRDFTNSLRASLEEHKKGLVSLFRSKLAGMTFTINDKEILGQNLTLGDILTEEVQLAYVQKFYNAAKGRSVYNPVSENGQVLDKFQKDIAKIVNRRKILTLLSQAGVKTSFSYMGKKMNIGFDNANSMENYVLLRILTHHMVDMPNNTSSFFYDYDNVKAFDQDHGTDFSLLINERLDFYNDIKAIDAVERFTNYIKDFENFLFGYMIAVPGDFNAEIRMEDNTLVDTLGYIQKQKELNNILSNLTKRGSKKALLESYESFLTKKYSNIKDLKKRKYQIDSRLAASVKYINGISVENVNDVKLNTIVNNFDLSAIPSFDMSEKKYIQSEGKSVLNMLNDPLYGWFMDKMNLAYAKASKAIESTPNEISDKFGNSRLTKNLTTNQLATALFFATYDNFDLHMFKAKAISMLIPIKQTSYSDAQVEKNSTLPGLTIGNKTIIDNIYQKSNAYVYPKLVELMFNRKSIELNDKKNNKVEFDVNLQGFTNSKLRLSVNSDGKLRVNINTEINGQKKYISYSTEDLLNKKNDKTAGTIKEYLFSPEGLFKSALNRFNLSTMVNLGKNTDPTERLEATQTLLQNELDKFSPIDQAVFWTSLFGKGDTQFQYPTNFSPHYNNENGFYANEKLMYLMAGMNNKVSKKMLDIYAQGFSNSYVGRNVFNSQKVEGLLEAKGEMGLEDQIWFAKNPELEKIESEELNNKKPNLRSAFQSIFSVETEVSRYILADIKNEEGKPMELAYAPDLLNGNIIPLHTLEVTNSFSAHSTKVAGPVNHVMIAKLMSERIDEAIKLGITAPEANRENRLKNIRDEILEEDITLTDEKIDELVNEIVDKNPLNITLRRNSKDELEYNVNNLMDDKGERVYYNREQLIKHFNDIGLDKTGKNVQLMALEYHERYGLQNIKILTNLIVYYQHHYDTLSPDFRDRKEIAKRIKDMTSLLERMKAMQFRYFPHIIADKDFNEFIKKQNEEQIGKDVREKVKDNRERMLSDNPVFDPLYAELDTEEKIKERIDIEILNIASKIRENQYGGFINTFEMKRNQTLLNQMPYVKNSNQPHQRHHARFSRMVRDNLYALSNMVFEYEASQNGIKQSVLNKMNKWFQNISTDRIIQELPITLDMAKANDVVSFYYRVKRFGKWQEKYIRGAFDRSDKDHVYLKLNYETMRDMINGEIKSNNYEYDDIVFNNTKNDKATPKQLRYIDALFNEKYVSLEDKDNKNITRQKANEVIANALNKKLNDSANWGKFKKDTIYIKQYKGTEIVFNQGMNRQIAKSKINQSLKDKVGMDIPDLISAIHMTSAAALLGGTSGAVRNWIDGTYALERDLRLFQYRMWTMPFRHPLSFWDKELRQREKMKRKDYLKGSRQFSKEIRILGETGDPEGRLSIYEQTANQLFVTDNINKNFREALKTEKLEAVKALATKYLLQNNLIHNVDLGKTILLDEEFYQGLKGKIQKAGELYSKGTKIATMPFKAIEGRMRRRAAYLYAYKAVFMDKLVNPEQIMDVIEDGIARTQSLYEMMYRKLGEGSQMGRLLFQFSQYNQYQLDVKRMEIDQAKRLGQIKEVGEYWKSGDYHTAILNSFKNIGTFINPVNIISPNISVQRDGKVYTYKAGDSVDPNLVHRLVVDWWIDTIGNSLGSLFPGFRATNPVNAVTANGIKLLAQMIVSGNLPDDWDMKQWLFSILSFYVGVGFTIPIQVVTNLVTGADDWFPVNSRIWTGAGTIYDAVTATPGKYKASEELYAMQKMEKTLLGGSYITPLRRRYQSYNQNYFTQMMPQEKALEMLLNKRGVIPGPAEQFIPIWNMMKDE